MRFDLKVPANGGSPYYLGSFADPNVSVRRIKNTNPQWIVNLIKPGYNGEDSICNNQDALVSLKPGESTTYFDGYSGASVFGFCVLGNQPLTPYMELAVTYTK